MSEIQSKARKDSCLKGENHGYPERVLSLQQRRCHVSLPNIFWRFWSEWRGLCKRWGTKGRINGLDTVRCAFSRPFLCPQQLSLPLPQHRQSLAVTHLHSAVWQSCLSSACSDKWNWTGLAGGIPAWESAFLGDQQVGPCCLLQRASWLQGISAKRGVSFCNQHLLSLCQPKVKFHFWCPGTWRFLD